VECHKGSHFSDDKVHVIGLAAEGEHINPKEKGRGEAIEVLLKNPFNSRGEFSDDKSAGYLDGVAASEAEGGKWRTKGLRNVAVTGPWMHTGQFDALKDIVEFYNGGGHESGFVGTKDKAQKELHLTDAEIEDLVAFLQTLTGEPVPAALRADTSKRSEDEDMQGSDKDEQGMEDGEFRNKDCY
jgi:cytochrome c peroxidase